MKKKTKFDFNREEKDLNNRLKQLEKKYETN